MRHCEVQEPSSATLVSAPGQQWSGSALGPERWGMPWAMRHPQPEMTYVDVDVCCLVFGVL